VRFALATAAPRLARLDADDAARDAGSFFLVVRERFVVDTVSFFTLTAPREV
jgi:hypothetical protein